MHQAWFDMIKFNALIDELQKLDFGDKNEEVLLVQVKFMIVSNSTSLLKVLIKI